MRKINKVAIIIISLDFICSGMISILLYWQQPSYNEYNNEESYAHSNLVNTHSAMFSSDPLIRTYKLLMGNI